MLTTLVRSNVELMAAFSTNNAGSQLPVHLAQPRKLVIDILGSSISPHVFSVKGNKEDVVDYFRITALLSTQSVFAQVHIDRCPKLLCLAAAEALKENVFIESFSADFVSSKMGVAMAGVLRQSTSLQSFTIQGVMMNEEMCLALAEAIPLSRTLRSFSITLCWVSPCNEAVFAAFAQALKRSKSLRSFSITLSSCWGRCPSHIETKKARSQSCSAGGLILAKALMQNNSLQVLSLCGFCFGHIPTLALVDALQCNNILHTLSIGTEANIGSSCSDGFTTILKKLTGLRSFSLTAALVENVGIALGKALQDNISLHTFAIGSKRHALGHGTVLALATAIKRNSTLRNFSISRASFCKLLGVERGIALADALKHNRTLHTMSIAHAVFANKAVVAIADAVKVSSSLRSFSIGARNCFSGRALIVLAEILKQNSSLQALSINAYEWADTDTDTDTEYACDPVRWCVGSVFVNALQNNVTLLDCELGPSFFCGSTFCLGQRRQLSDLLVRNRGLRNTWAALVALSRPQSNAGFGAFTNVILLKVIFACLLPPHSEWPWLTRVKHCQSPSIFRMEHNEESVSLDCDPAQASPVAFDASGVASTTLVCTATAPGCQTPDGTLAQQRFDSVVSPEDAEKSIDLANALALSAAEAHEQESSELAQAVLLSKADRPAELSADGVVLLRLDRHAQAEEVKSALLCAPELASCRRIVEEAGCQLRPDWANGAWLFVPVTQGQYEESGIDASSIHILMLAENEVEVRHALRHVPKLKRPSLRTVGFAASPACSAPTGPTDTAIVLDTASATGADSSAESTVNLKEAVFGTQAGGMIEIIVERTFLTIREVGDASSSHSAPARLEADG